MGILPKSKSVYSMETDATKGSGGKIQLGANIRAWWL